MSSGYPFSAIVGQEQLKTALLICAVNPTIGGIVIRGDKGSAKSTAARALAEVLPPIQRAIDCQFNCSPDQPSAACQVCQAERVFEFAAVPFVNLPIGATEDRLLGSLDFERALKEGRRAFQPGLLASAHRGILYIDEVNLLPDHLVDALLDVAAMGANTIQREGLSLTHPSRISLLGTMNLEEGDLRPQLLDRFAMLVEVRAPMDATTRAEIVRRRIQFEIDPERFAELFHAEQESVRAAIVRAQELLASVRLSDGLLHFISSLCCQMNVTSLRADIVMHKAARTIAALQGRIEVTADDIRQAAQLVLPHRMRKRPGERATLDQQKLDELFGNAPPPPAPPVNNATAGKQESSPPQSNDQSQGSQDDQAGDNQPAAGDSMPDQTFAATDPGPVASFELTTQIERALSSGKRSKVLSTTSGRQVTATRTAHPHALAVDATIRHSVLRNDGKLDVTRQDLHEKVRVAKTGNLILFVVDASGSMAAVKRMEAVKGTVIALLNDIYQRRDQVGVIAFRGDRAQMLLPPTRNVESAEQELQALPTGGRTPLAHALELACSYLKAQPEKQSPEPLLVVLTDGKANVSTDADADPWQQAVLSAEEIARAGFACLVLDTEQGYVRLRKAKELAEHMQATYMELDDLSCQALTITISTYLSRRGRR